MNRATKSGGTTLCVGWLALLLAGFFLGQTLSDFTTAEPLAKDKPAPLALSPFVLHPQPTLPRDGMIRSAL